MEKKENRERKEKEVSRGRGGLLDLRVQAVHRAVKVLKGISVPRAGMGYPAALVLLDEEKRGRKESPGEALGDPLSKGQKVTQGLKDLQEVQDLKELKEVKARRDQEGSRAHPVQWGPLDPLGPLENKEYQAFQD
uniref:Uncharacterized protein n=1 Tax=Cacopsylla melanoneura TaxID=428564 RepID=A0A8D8Y9R0_9HEMI